MNGPASTGTKTDLVSGDSTIRVGSKTDSKLRSLQSNLLASKRKDLEEGPLSTTTKELLVLLEGDEFASNITESDKVRAMLTSSSNLELSPLAFATKSVNLATLDNSQSFSTGLIGEEYLTTNLGVEEATDDSKLAVSTNTGLTSGLKGTRRKHSDGSSSMRASQSERSRGLLVNDLELGPLAKATGGVNGTVTMDTKVAIRVHPRGKTSELVVALGNPLGPFAEASLSNLTLNRVDGETGSRVKQKDGGSFFKFGVHSRE